MTERGAGSAHSYEGENEAKEGQTDGKFQENKDLKRSKRYCECIWGGLQFVPTTIKMIAFI